jgi:hypothetical protein
MDMGKARTDVHIRRALGPTRLKLCSVTNEGEMPMTSMLTPVLALIVWSLIIWIWMYATRIPAIQAAKMDPQVARHPGSLDGLPSGVRQVADNYNHLMEQPTIFYALVFYIVLAGHSDPLNVYLAWGYVALRVLHSLIQNTINVVPMRFMVFALSTLVLMVMAGRVAIALL